MRQWPCSIRHLEEGRRSAAAGWGENEVQIILSQPVGAKIK